MIPANPNQIVRCLLRDLDGDVVAARRYAEDVANIAERNPWGCPGDAQAYREAARRLCETKMEKKARRLASNAIGQLIHNRYFDSIPLGEISQVLRNHGFDPDALNGIYVGRQGRIHEQVGPRTFLSLSWYQMPSGRYEITAYLT